MRLQCGISDPDTADTAASEVHRARAKKTGALVALKKIIMHNEKDGVSGYLLSLNAKGGRV